MNRRLYIFLLSGMKDGIKYLTGLLFFVAVVGSILLISDIFVDGFYTTQSVLLLFVLLINGFLVLLCNKRIIFPFDSFFLFLLSGLVMFRYSFILFPRNELFCVCIAISLTLFVGENIKQKVLLNLSFVYRALSILGFIEALVGIFQYLKLFPVYDTNYNITGTFDNPAGFAICISVLFPFSLFLLRVSALYWKVAGCLFVFASGCAVLFSGSRTGLLALIIISVMHFYVFYLKQRIVGLYRRKIVWCISLLCLCLIVGLYYLKKDSADGRLLIWKVSCNMIKDSPLTGHGPGHFQSEYMLYQADYFHRNPDSRFTQLADNVKHPFNEYLKIGIEYGCLGITILFFIILRGIYIYTKNSNPLKYPVAESLIGIAVCACFSYPLKYPVIWGILAFTLSVLFMENQKGIEFHTICRRCLGIVISLSFIIVLLLYVTIELKWKEIADRALIGETEQILPVYKKLHKVFDTHGQFLYNYGVESYMIKHYDEAISILTECTHYWNDYDVQLILADCYMQEKRYDQAESAFLLASNMCPNRFVPLYHLVKLYDLVGQREKAYDLAKIIIHKKIKIPSFKVQRIIKDMVDYVKENRKDSLFMHGAKEAAFE